jgi:hypothetical protein
MKYSFVWEASATILTASALSIMIGSSVSYAAKVKPVVFTAAKISNQPIKLRYYGGPKSPMSH